MFDRFILASNFKRISERFNMAAVQQTGDYKPCYNISAGSKCLVIKNYQTREIYPFQFGLNLSGGCVPFVRAEGDRNPDDDPGYRGSKAIFLKPEYMHIIRKQRCLVLADAFVVGLDKMQPYLVYLRDKQRPFAFAGIWEKYFDDETGEETCAFAIITVPSNRLLQQLGCKRMPVILFQQYESSFIRSSTPLSEILNVLIPYPENRMNAYTISTRITDQAANDKSLIQPQGEPVFKEQQSYKRASRLGKR